jgi:hypothetical protein
MAHSYDNTRLAQFGFQDPDRKLEKHALACQYLSRRPKKILAACGIGNFTPGAVRCEAALSKGEGQYKTTIGFVDVQFEETFEEDAYAVGVEVKITPCSWDVALRQINLYREYAPTFPNWEPFKRPRKRWGVHEEPIAFWSAWILAIAFSMSASDVESLRAADVHVLRLGAKFERWVEKRKHKKNAELPEV